MCRSVGAASSCAGAPAPSRHIRRPSSLERWFRSLKCDKLKIEEYETPAQLRRLVAEYVEQYNSRRPHESLGYDTPSEWYYSGLMAA